jgi:GNAT superfamily N-acetyltransferase
MTTRYVLADRSLAQRLERTEAQANANFIEARARLSPDLGAEWIEVAGAYAMFDGIDSPCTQTFGLGLFANACEADVEKIEIFFRGHGAPVYHEISPLADKALAPMLSARGYEPFEFTSVMTLPLPRESSPSFDDRIRVRVIGPDEYDLFAEVAAAGWSELVEFAHLIGDLFRVNAMRSDGVSFIAELDGRPVATGGLSIDQGVALFAGASTVPEARKQGAQRALLDARLRYAAEAGCDLAMMCAEPGSASQRNAERQGFRIAYTRIKWRMKAR